MRDDRITEDDKYESFKVFYTELAQLHQIANQQTMFFAYLLSEMDEDNIVYMTVELKARIMKAIGHEGKNAESNARQLLKKLCRTDLLVRVKRGVYMVKPRFATRFKDKIGVIKGMEAKYIDLRMRAHSNGKIQMELMKTYE